MSRRDEAMGVMLTDLKETGRITGSVLGTVPA